MIQITINVTVVKINVMAVLKLINKLRNVRDREESSILSTTRPRRGNIWGNRRPFKAFCISCHRRPRRVDHR